MEIVNENYILIILEFDKEKKNNITELRNKLIVNHNKSFIQNEIDVNFIETIYKNYGERLDNNVEYLYPINLSIIKRIVPTIQIGGKQRFTNKAAGIMVLYKYMGPLQYITDFLMILKRYVNKWQENNKSFLNKIQDFNIILGSESELIRNIINQNLFLVCYDFNNSKADPNDFRRALLGKKKKNKGKIEDFHPNIPKVVNELFKNAIKEEYIEDLEDDIKFIFPIDFSIIKRPIIYKDGKKSDFAKGIMLLYKYMGPMMYVEKFKEIFQLVFRDIRNQETSYEMLKNKYFQYVNEPLIIIGADLKYYKDFDKV